MEEMIAHPLEVVRTKLQVDHKPFSLNSVFSIIKKTPVRGLYTAFWTCAIGFIPGNMAYILGYQYFKDKFQTAHIRYYPDQADGHQAAWVSFAAGLTADALAVGLYCPVDVVSQRRFIQDPANLFYTSTFDAVKKIGATEGIRGFYKGMVPLLVNSLPASALWWMLYESSKTYTSKKFHVLFAPPEGSTRTVESSVPAQIISGLFAGGITALVTNPLDVVRTRLQTQDAATSKVVYSGSIDAIKTIYRVEGPTAFIKGIGARSVQWSVFSGLSAYLYEFAVRNSKLDPK